MQSGEVCTAWGNVMYLRQIVYTAIIGTLVALDKGKTDDQYWWDLLARSYHHDINELLAGPEAAPLLEGDDSLCQSYFAELKD
jgi:hypothetical protein